MNTPPVFRRRFLQLLIVSLFAAPVAAFARRALRSRQEVPIARPPAQEIASRQEDSDRAKSHEDAVKEISLLFPKLPTDQITNWALTTTAYPLEPLADWLPNLREQARRFDGDHNAVWVWSEAECERHMHEAYEAGA